MIRLEELEVVLIHGYHVIFGAYGYWLPNDLRGSWTDFVGAWELFCFGRSTRGAERKVLTREQEAFHARARASLKYPAVRFTGIQARAVGRGFSVGVQKSRLTVWACSILPEHVHLVIGRHTYKVEQIVNLLKGEASKRLKAENLHPHAAYAKPDGTFPSPWAQNAWKVYLDTEEAIETAIHYVTDNPSKEGKREQHWPFVVRFGGLDRAWTTYR